MVQSVCPSVSLSVCLSVCLSVTPFFIMFPSSYHHDIFSSHYHWQKWCPYKSSRSKVKVTEVKTKFSRFRTVKLNLHKWWLLHKASCGIGEVPYHFELRPSSSMNGSVRPSVCPSVRLVRPSHLFDYFPIIVSSWVITNGKSDVHAKDQGQRSKVKVTEVMTLFSRFRTVTPVWIHILRWNDAYSLMLLRRGALMFFKVIRQISRSHG